MDVRLVVDAIVRQTTVLIAQLSTSAGIRAPLAHVADQVFLEMASEIENQGVGRKVVADMFGLGLRSYQRKVQRLTESATVRNRSLWEAVFDFLSEEGSASREQVVAKFRRDPEPNVAAVLADLVSQGLVHRTGRGTATVYGASSEADRRRLAQSQHRESLIAVVRLLVYRAPSTPDQVASQLGLDVAVARETLETLVAQAEVRELDGVYTAKTCLLPVGGQQGWEAAVIDHFRAVATAIAAKVRRGESRSASHDVVGGATLTFEIAGGHPMEDDVLGLLASVRRDVNQLWRRVEDYNREHPIEEDARTRVTFYFGQHVEGVDEEGEQDR
jgi:hypothetical protein